MNKKKISFILLITLFGLIILWMNRFWAVWAFTHILPSEDEVRYLKLEELDINYYFVDQVRKNNGSEIFVNFMEARGWDWQEEEQLGSMWIFENEDGEQLKFRGKGNRYYVVFK
ncbi:hypothetical protein [Natranaerobius thermophilus]|uniref:Uncharacterized protein n=1 Tax=Natranaerobius thermophilus (strain ATCC BAA-1301 / DSM 18059 / JW/NM-WN-LF) TaxID=457570 RepID=B2A131_NATTJ|nr:hypothetical protein [Natranaerobius thermophilus]ACB84654.1 hypothetical protein Nther_1070 [Natranaerobius thermophilus JW/NM-WN-LF]